MLRVKRESFSSSIARSQTAIRNEYAARGVTMFYATASATYRNPHEAIIQRALAMAVADWPLDLTHVLDLACGSGEVTLALRALGATQVNGVDPFTGTAYLARTGQAAEALDFAQIAAGALTGRAYSLIVCSFALHLCEPSRLPAVGYQLAACAPQLLILTPHKRPLIQPAWGWTLQHEALIERVRARLYQCNV